ncbi:uncharacterized protein KY384_004580 [Bacidia gigantensis]|uniref:uncharacterized protein n=1 Tax=Bacidia gigantensis TaxID=2732470 RepID=UPI001D03AB94|nr:uncharacterized protein KY384_004580 [Bacidia gigantensis]KAG8531222.1 hypothetical protein KY384_004580 [Bacidia gigantensis]
MEMLIKTCEFMNVPEKKLVDCLELGDLPLLRLREDKDSDKMSIEIVASTNSTPYVALSHVWTDGLGNPHATALPRCQLSRLKALIDKLHTSISLEDSNGAPELLLWCDTLCCPVISPEGKRMALQQMYRTYYQASMVLVLDRSFLKYRVGGIGADEACLRIAVSRWMTRLWTLQEGALGALKNKLWFQFKEMALNVATMYGFLIQTQEIEIQRRGIADNVIGRVHNLTLPEVQKQEHRGASFKDVMKGLLYRSVTVSSDEPIIIASLLGLDVSAILASNPQQRMQTLWRIMSTSPSGINKHIIFHQGPKICERGLRWAPQSLLSIDRLFEIPMPGEQEDRGHLVTDDSTMGLLVELAGFRISTANPTKGLPKHLAGFESLPQKSILKNNLSMRDGQGRWYTVNRCQPAASESSAEQADLSVIISNLPIPWVLYRGSSSWIPLIGYGYRGLLVEQADKQQSRSDQITAVEKKSHVTFTNLNPEMNRFCHTAYSLAQELIASTAGRRLAEFTTNSINLENTVYGEALQAFFLESQRLSRTSVAIDALASCGYRGDEQGYGHMNGYMAHVFRGHYIQLEEYAPYNRKWFKQPNRPIGGKTDSRMLQPSRRLFSSRSQLCSPASFASGPAPPRLPEEEQQLYEKLQRSSTGAFSTPRPSITVNQSPATPSSKAEAQSEIPPQINQSPQNESMLMSASDQKIEDIDAKVTAQGDGDELHPDVRRGAKPEFEGERNPRTGEMGGPKNEPLRWGAEVDWSYNGRVTDF